MQSNNEHFNLLIKQILPTELFEYFEINDVKINDIEVNVYLDEIAVKPDGFDSESLSSKGFHKAVVIQDFPLREKPMFLHVRRRRWLVESTGKVISRDWDSVAKGTRFTKGFATFLKEIFGQLPDQQ